jgi:hypothetical protein
MDVKNKTIQKLIYCSIADICLVRSWAYFAKEAFSMVLHSTMIPSWLFTDGKHSRMCSQILRVHLTK